MPDHGLITAVRSLLNQSWSDVEILIIDDGSPAEFGDLLQHCAELDSRVRLIRLDTNGGTYRARNVGLDCAKGAMVAFHDSDDWSHPLRLEAQARVLLENPSVLATTVTALGANDDLMITRPGRELLLPKQNSLMFRRNPVLPRIGYFDSVRKAADTEYQLRIRAVFGDHAVQEVESGPYALHRQRTDSLSGAEFRGGWVHPARAAYWFAYEAWHKEIRSGSVSPYLSKDPKTRPFAAGAHISGVDERVGAVDVAYVGDWRWFGETQRAAHDEIRGLTRSGLRVAVVQMESFRAMTTRRLPLSPPFQQLVNRGTVDQLLLAEAAEVGLLLVREPEVLLFPPVTPSRVRARTVLIVAGETPVPPESTDYRYEPRVCAAVAEKLFSARPRWCPVDAQIRDALSGYVEGADITPFDLPDSLDPRYWRLPRNGFRSHLPVAGVCGTDHPGGWPADRTTLLQVYPDSPDVDVRLLGSAEVPRSLLGTGQVPSNWLIYEPVDVSIRSFLNQIDFYVYFPQPERVGSRSRSLAEALAAGCVGIVPWELDQSYDGGVVRCRPDEVRDVIDHYRADEDAFLRQSRKAVAWVDRVVGGQSEVSRDPYHDLVASLLGRDAEAHPAESLRGALVGHGEAR